MKQRTDAWFMARCGKVTASEAWKVMSFLKKGENKGGETEARKKYKASVLIELITGNPDMTGYYSSSMERGNTFEDDARNVYELHAGFLVDQIGFADHPTILRFGASPDGLCASDGGLEIKVPEAHNFIQWKLSGEIPEEYLPQMYAGMSCTGRQWWDFFAYCPELEGEDGQFLKRLDRDEKAITELESGVIQFNREVDELWERLKMLRKGGVKDALKRSLEDYSGPEWLQDEDAKLLGL